MPMWHESSNRRMCSLRRKTAVHDRQRLRLVAGHLSQPPGEHDALSRQLLALLLRRPELDPGLQELLDDLHVPLILEEAVDRLGHRGADVADLLQLLDAGLSERLDAAEMLRERGGRRLSD